MAPVVRDPALSLAYEPRQLSSPTSIVRDPAQAIAVEFTSAWGYNCAEVCGRVCGRKPLPLYGESAPGYPLVMISSATW